jgi:hypothetical protein
MQDPNKGGVVLFSLVTSVLTAILAVILVVITINDDALATGVFLVLLVISTADVVQTIRRRRR